MAVSRSSMSGAEPVSRRALIAGTIGSCKSAFLAIAGVSVVINLLMLTGPLFMLQIYDRVLTSRSLPTLAVLAGLAAALYVFFGVLEGIRARALGRVGAKVDIGLSGEAFASNISLPLVTGGKGQGFEPVADLDRLRQFLSGAGPSAIYDMPWLPLYLAVVFLFHPILGLVATAGALIVSILILVNEWLSRRPVAEAAAQGSKRNRFSADARRYAEAIAAMGMAGALRNRWEVNNASFLSAQSKAADRASLFSTTIKTLRFVLQSAVLGVGGWLAILQEITPGAMIAASIITSRALAPVELAVAHWRGFVAARQSLGRLKLVLGHLPENEIVTRMPLPERSVELLDVASGPPGARLATVRGVSFSLRAGDGLGVIGPSGSGKTTLARAVVGVWPCLNGAVRLDGVETGRWDADRLGAAVGYLPQDVQLFDASVAENISRFAPSPSPDDVIAAAERANVHDLILSLPEAYDTMLGDGGVALSAGQRQRIALARALYRDPFLIVLDEPNSNLDAQGDAALNVAVLSARQRGAVVIVIGHRSSSIAAVDTLLVLQDGRQHDLGPKKDVLERLTAGNRGALKVAGHG